MTAGDGAPDGNKAQRQHYLMHAPHPPEVFVCLPMIHLSGLPTPHEGLHHEPHQSEDGPYQNHGMHPPVAKFSESAPCVEYMTGSPLTAVYLP